MAKMDGTKLERPILFSGEMVRAILEGRKSQTRRVVTKWNTPWTKHCSDPDGYEVAVGKTIEKRPWTAESAKNLICPYGKPGDSLWVRETWANLSYERGEKNAILVYRADDDGELSLPQGVKWKPSIHIPRWASRINLEITEVRVERIQEISNGDAKSEGVTFAGEEYRESFKELWDSINKKRGFGWEANPWVWCISFQKAERL